MVKGRDHKNPNVSAKLQRSYDQALAALQHGDPVKAEKGLRKIIKAADDSPEAHFSLALALQVQGKLAPAADHYRQSTELSPQSIEAWLNLGRVRLQLEQVESASKAFQLAIALDPVNPAAHAGAGESLAMAAQYAEAETCFRRALELAPNDPGLIVYIARMMDARGETERAEQTLRDALASDPGQVDLWLALGQMLQAYRRVEDAGSAYRDALRHHPEHPELLFRLANNLYEQQWLEEAEGLYRRLLEKDPKQPEVLNNLGMVVASLARRGEAESIFRELIETAPGFGHPYLNLALSHRFGPSDKSEIAGMSKLLRGSRLADEDALYVHYALGKALDDCGDHKEAFAHYRKANRLRRPQVNFNIEVIADGFERLKRVFSRELFEQFSGSGNTSRGPVLIVGMPRSGTTLLEQVLSAHPQIRPAGELRKLSELVLRLEQDTADEVGYPECVSRLDTTQVEGMASAYLAELTMRAGDADRMTDKMPMNFIYLGLMALLFPGASLLHCVRDTLDTCLSNYFQHFPPGLDYAYDLEELGRYYTLYQDLMLHWQAVLPDRLFDVHYEALVSEPRSTLEPVLGRLELPWDDACLAHHESVDRVQTLSLWQVRQPLNTTSVERWRHYENQLGPLIEALSRKAN